MTGEPNEPTERRPASALSRRETWPRLAWFAVLFIALVAAIESHNRVVAIVLAVFVFARGVTLWRHLTRERYSPTTAHRSASTCLPPSHVPTDTPGAEQGRR